MNDTVPNTQSHAGDRYIHGAAAIGKYVGLSAQQVSYFFRRGLFGDAVVKFGHRTMIGDARRLTNLAFLKRAPARSAAAPPPDSS
jgi:hypothetical protein